MKDLERHLYEVYERILYIDKVSREHKAQECDSAKLTRCQHRYLQILDANEPLTSGQFAELISVSKPTVSQLVNRFLADGYIVKEGCPHDKRSCYLRMTDKGRRVARADENARIEVVHLLAHNLNEDETIQLIELMNKLLDYVDYEEEE